MNTKIYYQPDFENDDIEWICTDSDANQWGRKIGKRTYEFRQDMKYPNDMIVKEEEEINLDKYTNEEINYHLSPYGWTIKQLKEENSLKNAEWLMAECIFEQIAN